MSINNKLDLKTRFVWARILESLAKLFNILGLREKETYNSKWNIYFGVMFFELWGRIFLASDNVQGTFVDFRFMKFTKVLMKELARILIHVHKIFKRRVSFKILLLMCLAIVENKLQHSYDIVTSGIELSKNSHNRGGSRSLRYLALTLLLNKK